MPVQIIDHPAAPECNGTQWFVENEVGLAKIVALAFVGRARTVRSILQGAEVPAATISAPLKERLRSVLLISDDADSSNRDGLLFETMCWVIAGMKANQDAVISDPHRRATQQGADTVQVLFNLASREIVDVTVYEQKCTDHARDKFRDEVLPSFRNWIKGARDDELVQIAIGLLDRYELNDAEQIKAFDRIVADRPINFRAALTVKPVSFPPTACLKLFKGYNSLGNVVEARFGDTFPLEDMRGWFSGFAKLVWAEVDQYHV